MKVELEDAVAQLRADAAAGRLMHWGRSTVIDENTGTAVIDAPLFKTLHAAADINADFPVGNAGVIHVYGYWFSATPTPYGLKRDRWVDGELAAALGLHREAFHLDVGPGTLLERVTAACLPHLQAPQDARPGTGEPAGRGANPKPVRRSADALVAGHRTRVVLVGEHPAALIYGVEQDGRWRLITTFPFAGNRLDLLDEFTRTLRPRWNAADFRSF